MSDTRRKALAMIHVAKRQLALEDEPYRDLLESVTKKRSAADLDARELALVLAELCSLGFVVTEPRGKLSPKTRGKGAATQADKIRAMWVHLGKAGVIRDPYEGALQKFCQRLTQVERIEWLNQKQAAAVIAALHNIGDVNNVDFP